MVTYAGTQMAQQANANVNKDVFGSILVNVKAYGAKGDGEKDDTNAIQNAVDAAIASGGGTVFIPKGTYMVRGDDGVGSDYETGGILITSSVRILMDPNAVLKAITSTKQGYRVINVMDCRDVIIQGGKIEGERTTHVGTDGEFGHGIRVLNSTRVFILEMDIKDCFGDGIVVAVDDEADQCKEIYIDRCKCTNNRRQGCSISSGDGIYITNSEFSDTNGTAPQAGLDIEANDGFLVVENVYVQNCKFHNNYTGVLVGSTSDNIVISDSLFLDSYHSAIEITGTTTNVLIENNFISNDADETTNGIIFTGGASNITINNNILCNITGGAGIASFEASHDITINGNEVYNSNFGISLSIASAYNYTITNNRFHDLDSFGILPATGFPLLDSLISGNQFHDINNDAIYGRMTRVSITNNRLRNISKRGIVGDGIVSCVIQGNYLTDNGTLDEATYPSIQFSGASSDNLIANNYIRNTDDTHFAIHTSSSTVTLPNTITENNCIYSNVVTPISANASDINFNNKTWPYSYTGSTTWDVGSLVDGAGETSSAITVTGAALGDFVLVSAPVDLQGITCNGYVSAANTVKIRVQNETGATIDLASGTWKVKLVRNNY